MRIIRTSTSTTARTHPRQPVMTAWAQRMACATVLHNLGLSYLVWHRATMRRWRPPHEDGGAVLLGGAHFVLRRSHEVLVAAQNTSTNSGRDARATFAALDLSRRILAVSTAVLAEYGQSDAEVGLGNRLFSGQGRAQPIESDLPEVLDGVTLTSECESSLLGVSSFTGAAAA